MGSPYPDQRAASAWKHRQNANIKGTANFVTQVNATEEHHRLWAKGLAEHHQRANVKCEGCGARHRQGAECEYCGDGK